jgi:hypothetical protein
MVRDLGMIQVGFLNLLILTNGGRAQKRKNTP